MNGFYNKIHNYFCFLNKIYFSNGVKWKISSLILPCYYRIVTEFIFSFAASKYIPHEIG